MAVAAPVRDDAAEHPRRALVEQRHQRGVHQRDLDVAAAAGPRALGQRGLDADGGEQPADEVDDRGAGLQRPPVLLAGDAHQAAHRLREEVVAGQRARLVRPGPERRHRARHQARVGRAQRLAVQAPARHQPRPEGLDQHVGARGQPARQLEVARVAEVERERALVAVEPEVVGRLALAPRRAPRARVVAAVGALDLDHVGAEVAEQHRRERPGEHAREVGHEDAVERSHRPGTLMTCARSSSPTCTSARRAARTCCAAPSCARR